MEGDRKRKERREREKRTTHRAEWSKCKKGLVKQKFRQTGRLHKKERERKRKKMSDCRWREIEKKFKVETELKCV